MTILRIYVILIHCIYIYIRTECMFFHILESLADTKGKKMILINIIRSFSCEIHEIKNQSLSASVDLVCNIVEFVEAWPIRNFHQIVWKNLFKHYKKWLPSQEFMKQMVNFFFSLWPRRTIYTRIRLRTLRWISFRQHRPVSCNKFWGCITINSIRTLDSKNNGQQFITAANFVVVFTLQRATLLAFVALLKQNCLHWKISALSSSILPFVRTNAGQFQNFRIVLRIKKDICKINCISNCQSWTLCVQFCISHRRQYFSVEFFTFIR